MPDEIDIEFDFEHGIDNNKCDISFIDGRYMYAADVAGFDVDEWNDLV